MINSIEIDLPDFFLPILHEYTVTREPTGLAGLKEWFRLYTTLDPTHVTGMEASKKRSHDGKFSNFLLVFDTPRNAMIGKLQWGLK